MLNRLRLFHPLYWIALFTQALHDGTRVLGPIFQIESLITIRRARYYLLRAFYGVIVLLVLWTTYTSRFASGTVSVHSASEFAFTFFYSFATLQLTAAVLVTAAVTAGTIAEERERRTIEYLFATDLSNSEIVLGKLASRLVLIVLFLLTALPILALTLLFGGIDINNLLQLFAATLSTVTAAASLSMCISVWSRRPREAITRAFIMLLLLLVLPLFSILFAFFKPALYAWIAPINAQLLISNPFLILIVMGNGAVPFPAMPAPGWLGVGELVRNHAVLTVVTLFLAVWRLRRVHMVDGAPKRRSALAMSSWHVLRPNVGAQAMLWKELFAEPAISGLGIVGRILVVFLFLGIMTPVSWQFFRVMQGLSHPEQFQELVGVLTTVIGSLFLLVLAARAATSVTAEKERQCWETLISTPLTGWEIVLGKAIGNMYALRWLIYLMGLLWTMATCLRWRALESALLMFMTVALLSPFFVGMGMMFSLLSRTSTRAMCWSMLVSSLAGGGYLLVAAPLTDAMVSARLMTRHNQEAIHSASVPYLLAWAGSEELRRPPRSLDSSTFSVSVLSYSAMGVCLLLYSLVAFDRIIGRPRGQITVRDRELVKVVVLEPDDRLRFPSEPIARNECNGSGFDARGVSARELLPGRMGLEKD